MTKFQISEIAKAIGARVEGDAGLCVSGAAEPQDAGPDQIAIATAPAFLAKVPAGAAKVALVAQDADWAGVGLQAAIIVERPKMAMAEVTRRMDPRFRQPDVGSIHPTAVIAPTAKIGPNAHIGPFCVIGDGVIVGADARFGAHVTIGLNTQIGDMATLADGVKIQANVRIGARFIAHPGVVIGGDGFSFTTPEPSNIEAVRASLGAQTNTVAQSYVRVHSLGGVVIGDDVEVGANTCIDRGTIRDTEIGNGCKFDNLAQIGHNVQIGNDCLICAQVGIAGSSVIGNNVVLGGQTGVSDNVTVGDNAITGGATKVLANVPSGRVMLGYPAMKMQTHLEIYKSLRRLPRLMSEFNKLKKEVFKDDT